MNTPIFRGVAAAVVTPTDEKGVDYVSFARLLNFLIDSGVDAIVVCGTTGESSTLSEDEWREAIAFTVRQVRGRVPVIAGTGCNATDRCVSLSRYAADAGADALLVVTPYYNKCTQNGLLRHYEAVAGSTDKPIIVYNVPTRTCVNIEPRTYCELAKIPNIRAVKEASSSVVQAARTKRLCGDALDIYSGNDDLILPLLSIGGAGVISVAANVVPKAVKRITDLFFAGDTAGAAQAQLALLDLAEALFCEVNPIPVKAALSALGFCRDHLRLPLTPMEPQNRAKLFAALRVFYPDIPE